MVHSGQKSSPTAGMVALMRVRLPSTPKLATMMLTEAEAVTLAQPPGVAVKRATVGVISPSTVSFTPPESEALTVMGTGPTMNVLETEKKVRLQLMGAG